MPATWPLGGTKTGALPTGSKTWLRGEYRAGWAGAPARVAARRHEDGRLVDRIEDLDARVVQGGVVAVAGRALDGRGRPGAGYRAAGGGGAVAPLLAVGDDGVLDGGVGAAGHGDQGDLVDALEHR